MKRSLSCLMFALLLISCGGGDDGAGPGGGGNTNGELPDPVATAEGTPDGTPTTQTIGAAGGSITNPDAGFTIDIPAGALASDTEITIAPTTNTAWGGIGKGVRLTPDGLTFALPVSITFDVAPESLAGSAPDALDIAVQDDAGFWFILKNRSYDENTGKLTCTTTHFSNYAGVEGVQLRPPVADVGVNGTVNLSVELCYFRNISNNPNISAALLTCSDNNIYQASEWSVNGVPGGNTAKGRVAITGGNSNKARYTAPASVPTPNPVAVSCKLTYGSRQQLVLVSNIQVFNGFHGSITSVGDDNGHDIPDKTEINVTWTSEGAIGGFESFYGEGTVTYTLVDQVDCPSESLTPDHGPIDKDQTYMTINRGVNPPLIIVHIVASWNAQECYQCLTDPEYCSDVTWSAGFSDNQGYFNADETKITGYALNVDTGAYFNYEFTR